MNKANSSFSSQEVKCIFAFDLDHTLLKGNSSFQFCLYLIRAKKLSPIAIVCAGYYYLRHRFGGLSLSTLHEKVFGRFLIGRRLDELKEDAKAFTVKITTNQLYPPAMEMFRWAQSAGSYVMILSNSPTFLVEPIAQMLGADDWRGSDYGVDKEGKLCEILLVVDGEQKREYLTKKMEQFHVSPTEVTAFSDRVLDLPLLEFAGNAVAVKPERKLERIAKQKNWKII